MIEALDIEVHGVVQGVGFRPFVYNAAISRGIRGWVLNGTAGVFIHAEGESESIDSLIMEINDHAPAAARVSEICMRESELQGFEDFEIRYSEEAETAHTTLVSPDLAMCDECTAELFDPKNRRFHYPFINCTNCGPRFTIIDGLPYDRAKTSMERFAMCDCCEAEYRNPADRRFHAQPDACFECGPHISWWEPCLESSAPASLACAKADDQGVLWGCTLKASDAIIERAAAVLREGGIVAVKGLGGFHLACDARNEEALAALRARKHREGKAFAVMYRTIDEVREICHVSDAEARLLEGPQRPIVLLKKRDGATFAKGLADHLGELGVMLPYTPVQHLLLAAFGGPLVMTSGNLHDEPICMEDSEARNRLAGIADAFLGNNRPIRCRFDDSVVRVIRAGSAGDAVQMVRRARGYAPMPIAVEGEGAPNEQTILACGPEQKNTFCLLRGNEAFVSQHIGDMENADVLDAWLAAKTHFEELFQAKPELLAIDAHPEYLSSKWAEEESRRTAERGQALPMEKIQHHHAHIVSAMAECGLNEAVIGIAFDGTGYGADGCIWGGETLLANRLDFERFANFAYVPMPGGAAAVKNPLRMAYGVLYQFDLLEHPAAQPVIEALGEAAGICESMIERDLNCPLTSSVGRLFDATSALLGICENPSYEGEAAVLLEAAIRDASLGRPRKTHGSVLSEPYHIEITKNSATATSTAHDTSVVLLDAAPAFEAMLNDMSAGLSTGEIARKFHDCMVEAIVHICLIANAEYGISTVVLAGGVFMNRYLTEHALSALEAIGFTVALNKELPCNDGGVSFGQAVIAAARNASKRAEG